MNDFTENNSQRHAIGSLLPPFSLYPSCLCG